MLAYGGTRVHTSCRGPAPEVCSLDWHNLYYYGIVVNYISLAVVGHAPCMTNRIGAGLCTCHVSEPPDADVGYGGGLAVSRGRDLVQHPRYTT